MLTRDDKEYQKAKRRRSYLKNIEVEKARQIVNQKNRRQKQRELIKRYKLFVGCVVCGYKRCYKALELHHTGEHEKFSNVSLMARNNKTTKHLKNEIRKCIVVCANCHREIHAGVIDASLILKNKALDVVYM